MEKLSPEIRNAYWFQGFNALSWQICVGTPLILFAKDLNASATTIGLLAGLTPLLSILQLPVSRYAEDIGYRKLMLLGWTTRSCILLCLAILPLLGWFLSRETLLNLLLAIMFFYNLLRSLSLCAWFPWITSLVPESLRGYYLSRDRSFINVASIIALFISGCILAQHPGKLAYSFVFFFSFVAAMTSLRFLNRIPDCPPRPASEGLKQIEWLEPLRYVPFQRLLCYAAVTVLGLGANTLFAIIFLRDELGVSSGAILWLSSASALTGMIGLAIAGPRTDRVGSKPFLSLVWFGWLIYFLGWFLLALKVVPHPKLLGMGLFAISGFFGSILDLSLTRLLLNTAGSRPGKAQYFALYSVIMNVIMGVIPLYWGMFLDALHHRKWTFQGIEFDRFSIYFGTEWLMLFVIAIMLARIKESKIHPTSFVIYEIFVGMPTRGILSLIQRLR